MKTKTLQKLASLDAELNQLFSELSSLSKEKLEEKPSKNSWNILQVLEHLRLSEELSLKYLTYKKTQNETYQKTGFKEKFNVFMLKQRLNSPRKITAPSEKLIPKSNGLEIESIIKSWKSIRAEFKSFFDQAQDEDFTLNLYKQPAIGRINLYQMLQFFEAHTNRHKRQIQKILEIS